MGFLTFFMVALMPVLMSLLIVTIGLILAIDRVNLLGPTVRQNLNNLVFYVFSPCLMAAYLAKTITLEAMLEMWFMPINILIAFIAGSALGWILVKITKPPQHLQGLVIGCCTAGNLRNLPLILIPAICNEPKSPFGDYSICMLDGAAFVSISMAVAAIYTWSYVYIIMKISAEKNNINAEIDTHHSVVTITSSDPISEITKPLLITKVGGFVSKLENIKNGAFEIVKRVRTINLQMLFTPTNIGSIIGLVIGVSPDVLKRLLIGSEAPLRILYGVSDILGAATVPCVTLILGANLLRGLRRSELGVWPVIGVIAVRFTALPLLGIVVVRAAHRFGMVGSKPFYQFFLMLQFAMPPAMQVGTISQLIEAGEGECSVIMLWTYMVSALAVTLWSTLFMWLVV
ncbi:unnamed protein product [Amaranthus hypochondriacus]